VTARAILRSKSWLALGLLLVVGPMPAQEPQAQSAALVTDLSKHLISVTSSFTGTELLLFGTKDPGGDVIVVVRGPDQPVVVRRKEKVVGIWLNQDAVEFDNVPGYYAVAASQPVNHMLPERTLRRLQIGAGNLRFRPRDDLTDARIKLYGDAVVRHRFRDGLYQPGNGQVNVIADTLFRANLEFPANVPVGNYTAQVFLVRDRQVVGAQSIPLYIKKTGLERAVFDLAQRQPLIYGLLAVILALVSGWLAALIFRRP